MARRKANLERAWAQAFPDQEIDDANAQELRNLAHEYAKRQIEALRLYEPMPEQDRFHRSKCRMRIVRGSNRSGKTLCSHIEVARAACGCDPFDKYPKRDGRVFVVGKDLDHLAKTMWPKFGKAGAFKIIRDQETGLWRAYRPWTPGDAQRQGEAKLAPPIIPPRLLRFISWENKKQGIPKTLLLHTGWEISFYSSLGLPTKGADIDIFLFDEEIENEGWYPEMQARILDRNGCGIWSATPEAGTEQLYELHERADKELGAKKPGVQEFVLLLAENLHLDEEVKKEFAASLSEEDIRIKVEGQFAQLGYKVYPEFTMQKHGIPWREMPSHWTFLMIVDPGHQVCASLFAAVTPPEEDDIVVLFDELYLRDCNAAMWAENVRHKVTGKRFHAFIIDQHMAMHTEMGVGKNVAQQYSEALRKVNVKSHTTGYNFILASDDVSAGVLAVHDLLRERPDGNGSRLKVLEGGLPAFEYEIKRYHRKREGGIVIDKPNQKKSNHLMDCLRYLAMYNPRYIRPSEKKTKATGAIISYRAKQKKKRELDGGPYIRLGPGLK
jgi:hypothetical protein